VDLRRGSKEGRIRWAIEEAIEEGLSIRGAKEEPKRS
jgi:hypothetical protein